SWSTLASMFSLSLRALPILHWGGQLLVLTESASVIIGVLPKRLKVSKDKNLACPIRLCFPLRRSTHALIWLSSALIWSAGLLSRGVDVFRGTLGNPSTQSERLTHA